MLFNLFIHSLSFLFLSIVLPYGNTICTNIKILFYIFIPILIIYVSICIKNYYGIYLYNSYNKYIFNRLIHSSIKINIPFNLDKTFILKNKTFLVDLYYLSLINSCNNISNIQNYYDILVNNLYKHYKVKTIPIILVSENIIYSIFNKQLLNLININTHQSDAIFNIEKKKKIKKIKPFISSIESEIIELLNSIHKTNLSLYKLKIIYECFRLLNDSCIDDIIDTLVKCILLSSLSNPFLHLKIINIFIPYKSTSRIAYILTTFEACCYFIINKQ